MSLYTIEQELLELFAHIEDNDGEISDEMYAKLELTKENLFDKLGNYVKAIRNWETDIVSVKAEVERLGKRGKIRENRIKRLKVAMLDAVQKFGTEGKTNKFIDLPFVKLFTKGTPSVETDDIRITLLISELQRLICELVDNGILYTGSDVELQGLLDSINANLKAEHENHNTEVLGMAVNTEFIPFTLTDLTTIKLKVSITKNVYDLFRTSKDALTMYGKDPLYARIENATMKEDWKTAILTADAVNSDTPEDEHISHPTVAKIVKNQSIQIR